jgi:hypothetical protein
MTQPLVVAGLRARAVIEACLTPRREPRYVRQVREFAIYPDGYSVDRLGTFPAADSDDWRRYGQRGPI